MNASEILKIKHPEKLFTGSLVEAKKEYHNLSRQWHPDVNKDKLAGQVFAHISSLYRYAEEKLAHGAWGTSVLHLIDKAGKSHTVKYHTGGLFELGAYYIGEDHVTYVLDDIYKDLWINAEAMTKKFNFASDKMSREMGPCLPDPIKAFETKEDLVLVVSKPAKLIRLRDVLEHYGGKVDPKHVAWIQSRLHNICCYLHYAKLTHNEISPDTVFIDPVDHKAVLLGGWWYARPAGKPLKQVSKRTHGLLPWRVKTEKRASRKTDLELVKATGRDLFGPKGKAPADMADYLKSVATKNAFDEYKDWGEVLLKSFGSRRFTVMDLKPEQVYPVG